MKVLVACEYSQVVTKAFRKKGHEAFSCDILPSEGGHPEWHFQEDVFKVLKREKFDMMIAHPPCTDLSSSGARWFKEKIADGRQQKSIRFFFRIARAQVSKICIENPVGIMSREFRKPDQYIQPYEYGHAETKKTCLWLKGLPVLAPTDVVEPDFMKKPDGTYYVDKKGKKYSRTHFLSFSSGDRGKIRSLTFQGWADAMADQWGGL